MVSETSAVDPAETAADEGEPNTILNAGIGAVVGIVLSFVPLSTVLGGAVAGYLQGGDTASGLRVGAIAGVVMLVPLALIGLVGATFFLGFGSGGPPIAFGIMGLFVLLLAALYTIGLSALGGYLGVYVKNEM